MSIVILVAEDGRGSSYGMLAASETERPVPIPLFANRDAAKDFLEFARTTMRGDHLESLTSAQWERIHDAWLKVACSACWTRTCTCLDCGQQCDCAHGAGCRESVLQ